ncbi:peptidase S51 dipeptidase E [Bacillus sp. HNG]|uniref:Type 1 glutamine amidotransferase-like domain-containing protein n=1 Tax=Bacillus sp. HNG TaxID=2293325 RepID=UPI000E2E81FC|nr:Type 1 glutamine amidotransferase-like domain-containing protein [Bacillus sp. HNG]RFB13487.1 peptidase S51 dipeptidase E [Bacillus sp. HNG]
MTETHLFLFGGGPPFTDKLGEQFANLSGNQTAKIAILYLERPGWQEYMPSYTKVLEENGVRDFYYFALSEKPTHDQLAQLETCSGIIIGGGVTELYHTYIVDTPVGDIIRKMFDEGVPVAGFSAGTLVSCEHCVISPEDALQQEQLYLLGLGLLKNCVISVHFSEWNEEKNLIEAVSKMNVPGYGIDENSGIYFKNGQLVEHEGGEPHLYD